MLVFSRFDGLLLDCFEPLGDAHRRLRRYNHRNRVDEKTDHSLDAFERFGAACNRRTERDRVSVGVALKQQEPRGLDQRIQRDVLMFCEFREACGALCIER